MIAYLVYILGEEKIEIVSESQKVRQFLGTLIKSYYPDMRMVIGQLQTACVGGRLDVDEVVINNKEIVHNTLSHFLNLVNSTNTPLQTYNNEILSFGNNGNLSELCSVMGLATGILNFIIDNCNASSDDLMALIEYIYKIEHSVDQETMMFGFMLKVKSMNLQL